MITYKRSTCTEELEQILRLQRANLPNFLSSEEKITEGFVTVHHDLKTLKAMHEKCPHILAKDDDTVVGYALSMHPDFGESIDVLKPMFKEINHIINSPQKMSKQLRHDNFIVMGQICVDKAYRKQGIFRKLYETMQNYLFPPFSAIITEVDATNTRSLQAHYAIGFKDVTRYRAGGQAWTLIVLS